MAIAITIPRLGWNMEEGRFVGWLRPDGTMVQAGEPLFSLESDKATEEVQSLDPGVLRHVPGGPKPGDTLAVGHVIGYLLRPDETPPWENAGNPAAAVAITTRTRPAPEKITAPAPSKRNADRVKSSPRARRVALELGIDLQKVTATGRTGRIRERDVRTAARSPIQEPANPLNAIRRLTAERMLESHRSTAPVTLTTTADASNLVNLRLQFQTAPPPAPSYTDFLVKLAASALARHPKLNARWEQDRVVEQPAIHIGIAVDTEQGLLVPVLRDVPALSLRQLAEQSRSLIERARQQQLSVEDLQGGTFTVTNLGSFGIDAFTPLINCPQCAVLGIGRIRKQPAVVGDQVHVREQITLSLTFDHRIVDGAPAARFLQTLCALIENPGPALMG
jgi:pyruvate dehydrogenase E2 component (dihydrolipoamide acetyltransferase)